MDTVLKLPPHTHTYVLILVSQAGVLQTEIPTHGSRRFKNSDGGLALHSQSSLAYCFNFSKTLVDPTEMCSILSFPRSLPGCLSCVESFSELLPRGQVFSGPRFLSVGDYPLLNCRLKRNENRGNENELFRTVPKNKSESVLSEGVQGRLMRDRHRLWGRDVAPSLLALLRAPASHWSLAAFEVSGVPKEVNSEK